MTIRFNEKKGFICDMDGVIYHGNKILPGVTEFIEWLQNNNKQYLFLTNNSGMTPQELHQKLKRMGLEVSEEHFYTSALATAAFIKAQTP
ncbi:MAG: TIGR01457 family HAD-type hydrolase, partial [Frisingicoccus sp.]|nr:TIGR01457 family HAD-type hydrolase [Frisingicoccus sp.]